jgi:hypothetical protein
MANAGGDVPVPRGFRQFDQEVFAREVKGVPMTGKVAGDQLTLTAEVLTRLSGSRSYGTNAVLTARFSQGTPWRFSVITYDQPVLSNATGTTASFAIPTAFRGDQLATMEAKYDDGTNAGPQNWTSYKEFDRAFAPNYATGVSTLTPEFFAEVNDHARVTLTFHYWTLLADHEHPHVPLVEVDRPARRDTAAVQQIGELDGRGDLDLLAAPVVHHVDAVPVR